MLFRLPGVIHDKCIKEPLNNRELFRGSLDFILSKGNEKMPEENAIRICCGIPDYVHLLKAIHDKLFEYKKD